MVSQSDRDAFEYRRNPPEFEDQEDSSMGSFSAFGAEPDTEPNPFGEPSNPYGSADGSNPLGGQDAFGAPGSAFGSPSTPGGMPGADQQQKQPQNTEDAIFGALASGAKGVGRGSKAFAESVAESNARVFAKTGNRTIRLGMGVSVLGAILLVFGFFMPIYNGLSILAGGIVTTIIGLLIFAFTYDKAKEDQEASPEFAPTDATDGGFFDDSILEPEEELADSWDEFEDDDDTEWEEDEVFDDGWIEDEDDGFNDDHDTEPEISVEEAKERLDEMTPGMQTRAHLFERYGMVLPHVTPGFDEWTEIDVDEDMFVNIETYLIEAAEVTGLSERDDPPTLDSLRENNYVLEVVYIRDNKKVNAERIGEELASIYASRVAKKPGHAAIYAKTMTSGKEVTTYIFKDSGGVVVSLKDTYKEVGEWVRNPDVAMPVVLGVSEDGEVWKVDFSKLYSALISGMPRSGKSWQTTAIFLQIAMYCSPKEVNFYMADTKNELSDYHSMNIPHIKEFAGTIDEIMSMMEWIVNVEGPRRKNVIGASGGEVNYNDYIESNPDRVEDVPRLYFVIDEMMALTSSLSEDKDRKALFNSYLKTIVSQFPGLGIYFIGIPHRVNNNVIPKDAYALIQCNIAVLAKEEDVKNAIGVTKREFPYNLTNLGESAIKIDGVNGGNVAYSKGIAIAPTNSKNREITEFIRSMWSRLDHEWYHGPRQDELDKKNDIFDGYVCGHESKGGIRAAAKGRKNKKKAIAGSSGILGGLKGGYVEEESIRDITEDWPNDDDVPLI